MGAVLKCAPPLRAEKLALTNIEIVTSDHSPAPPSMKSDPNFFRVWGGVAGVQHTLAVVFDQAGAQGAAMLLAANPARRFGLERKGRIEVGCDADFVLVDAGVEYTVTRESLFQRHGFSPYIGATFRGAVRRTILRGRTIFEDGRITSAVCGKMVGHAKARLHA
jgi:allantoinase